ncbi:Dihydrodipicolinate synthase [Aspergillus sclerotialis]|uniref:Dihydrodipicolinate synthase n=1 Tax=Aspergillus sclerotialis TaxID=2070753 RepID=A0A3A2ZJ74_9EURO|nr:Dihydrodipicolinate synthase [Aspergillus sclerotialis]
MTSAIPQKSKPLPEGIYCPVISIYKSTPRQEIDLDASYNFFSYLIRAGIDGLVLAGTTAEAVLLSPAERQDLLRVARKAADDLGLKEYPLVAGISGQSTNETIRLAHEAQNAGADYGLLLPPNYWAGAVNKDVILGFYREVADNSGIPIVIYSFPAVCNGIDMNSDILSELAQHPNIVGVKLTCGNAGKVTRLTQEYTSSQFAVHAGSSDWLLPCLIGGGAGCVTGIANIFPKSVTRLNDLWNDVRMNINESRKLQGLIAQAEKACKQGIACTKYGTDFFLGRKIGINDEQAFWPRRPYKPCTKETQDWVVGVMEHLVEIEHSLQMKYV